eukprot:51771-Rhodomonas_salina.2
MHRPVLAPRKVLFQGYAMSAADMGCFAVGGPECAFGGALCLVPPRCPELTSYLPSRALRDVRYWHIVAFYLPA